MTHRRRTSRLLKKSLNSFLLEVPEYVGYPPSGTRFPAAWGRRYIFKLYG